MQAQAQAQRNTRVNNLNANGNTNSSTNARNGKFSIFLCLRLYFKLVNQTTQTQAQTQGNAICKNTCSMLPMLKLKPRRHNYMEKCFCIHLLNGSPTYSLLQSLLVADFNRSYVRKDLYFSSSHCNRDSFSMNLAKLGFLR